MQQVKRSVDSATNMLSIMISFEPHAGHAASVLVAYPIPPTFGLRQTKAHGPYGPFPSGTEDQDRVGRTGDTAGDDGAVPGAPAWVDGPPFGAG